MCSKATYFVRRAPRQSLRSPERVDAARRDRPGSHDGLAECCRGGQHAVFVGFNRGHRCGLHIMERAEEFHIERSTDVSFVFYFFICAI